MNLFELVAKIGMDTSEFEQGIKQSQSVFATLSSKVSAGTVAIGTLMADVVKKGASMAVELGKSAISYNMQMEDYQTNFAVMLGSAEEAEKKVAELSKFAASTPFEMSHLADATQTLLAFGVQAEDTDRIMKMLGDVSLGNAEKFASITRVFGQVSSTGKLMAEDLNQFIDAGFNPLLVIADEVSGALGGDRDSVYANLKKVMSGEKITDSSFKKMIKNAQKEVKALGEEASEGAKLLAQIGEDGEISAEMLEEAFALATSEGGQYFDGMAAASQTLSGRLSTLGDNLQALGGKVLMPLTNYLSDKLLPAAIDAVDGLSAAYDAGGLLGMLEWAIGMFDFPSVSEIISGAKTWWENTGRDAVLSVLNWTLGQFDLPDVRTISANMQAWWTNDAKPTIDKMLSWALGVFNLPDAGTIVSSVQTWWTTDAKPKIDALLGWALGAFHAPDTDSILSSIKTWWGSEAKPRIDAALSWALGVFNPPDVKTIIDALGAWWGTSVAPSLARVLTVAFKIAPENASLVIDALSAYATGIINKVQNVFTIVFSVVTGDAELFVETVKKWWDGVGNTLKNLLTIALQLTPPEWESVKEILANISDDIVNFFAGADIQQSFEAVKSLGSVLAQIAALTFGSLTGLLTLLIGGSDGMGDTVNNITLFFKDTGEFINKYKGPITALLDALIIFFAIQNPFAALIAALATIITNWGDIKAGASNAWEATKTFLGAAYENTIGPLVDGLASSFETLWGWIDSAGDALAEFFGIKVDPNFEGGIDYDPPTPEVHVPTWDELSPGITTDGSEGALGVLGARTGVTVNQYITTPEKSAADLMQEARWQFELLNG